MHIAYTGNDSAMLTHLRASPDLRVYKMDLSTVVAALKERKLSGGIYAPDTSPAANDPLKITLYTLTNDLQSAIEDFKFKDIFPN